MRRCLLVFGVLATILATTGEAEACRIYRSPAITYDRWFEEADQIILGRVLSVGQSQEAMPETGTWLRPFMDVERTNDLRGEGSPDTMRLQGEDVMNMCAPTLHSQIRSLRVGDEVLVMLDGDQTAIGLMSSGSTLARSYVARLRAQADRKP